jgi:uncharacterized glyoxalase superfamily protein PhnB
MTDTTTTRPADLHAYFGYRDAPAAIAWLERVFGFETTMSFPDADGDIAHSELRLGDAVVVVFSDRDGYERAPRKGDTAGFGTYVSVPDGAEVDSLHARALAAGATVIWAPGTTEWGNYRCRVLDPEGFEWTFGTHRPGEPVAEEWAEG